MSELSTKPYLIRAIYDWCVDSGLTPYLAVQVNEYTHVPMAYVKDGKIVLNISMDAVKNLQLGNEDISCGGRFGGAAHQLSIPVDAVMGIFAQETGQGLVFQGQESSPTLNLVGEDPNKEGDEPPPNAPAPQRKPKLTVVK